MKKILLVSLLLCAIAFPKIWKREFGGQGGGGNPTIPFTFTTPLLRQIAQRSASNLCTIPVSGASTTGTLAQVRATPVPTYSGVQTGWQTVTIDGTGVNGTISTTPGWYTLEIKIFQGLSYISHTISDKVGCGDNFVIGGQSNGANYYTPLTVTPPGDMVNSRGITVGLPWRLATDPQDTADNTNSSIVPALGNLLSAHTTYPVGFISTSLGNTAIHQWIPGTANYLRIKAAIQLLGANGFRSFIWIQGENDAAFSTTQAAYYADWVSIIDQMRTDISWPTMPCGMAVTEVHPNEATGAGTQAGQTQGATYTGCYVGANPDTLNNTYRADGVHFNTTTGQLAHATLWYNAIVTRFGI